MDGQQFDDLARGLAATRSRRSVLKGVLAALVSSVAGSARAPARTLAAPGICDQRGYQACQRDARERFRLCTENCNGAFCRGADRDPDMCVGCQTNCLLIRHRDEGQCQAAGGCSAGQACCGDACVDLSTDPGNCGACGDACGEHKVCSDGSCECAAGYLNCGDGVCRDPQTDQHFCGCYTDCGDCYICQDGTCTPTKPVPAGRFRIRSAASASARTPGSSATGSVSTSTPIPLTAGRAAPPARRGRCAWAEAARPPVQRARAARGTAS